MDTNELLATRTNAILAERSEQIAINILAYHGGNPYIEERLSRFPSESETDFNGDQSINPPALGRLQRAFLINYAKRIAHKLNQYVFQTEVDRTGIEAKFAADATTTGMSINQFMAEASALLTTSRWCWIGIDRPASTGGRSIAAREASGDRIYWQLYNPNEVVDWDFDASGGLAWLITERTITDNHNPRAEPVTQKVRYLWEPGTVTKMVIGKDGKSFVATEEIPVGIKRIPFVHCGLISPDPWWFDDIERIQRAIMDMLSSRDTNIFKTVFPLLVISDSFANQVQADGLKLDVTTARRKIGIGNPLSETAEESGITRYLGTSADVFAVIQTAKTDLEKSLYDIVGLNMSSPDSRQVSSAESKAWDHMDPEAVLKERANILEEIEAKAVEISVELGGGVFKAYKPIYGKHFDISDFAADIAAITSTTGFTLPPLGERMVQKAMIKTIGRRFNSDDAEIKAASAEVDTYEPPTPSFMAPSTPDPETNDADPDQNRPTTG